MSEELGKFAETIFKRTYAHHPDETWDDCAKRVAKAIAEDNKELEKEFYGVISTRKFMPGGRYLAQSGREIQQLNNCLSGETRIVTDVGHIPIKELAGKTANIVTYDEKGTSRWVKSPIKSFGKQKLYKIILQRAGKTKQIFATREHEWYVRVINSNKKTYKKVTTEDLKENHELKIGVAYQQAKRIKLSQFGILHGLWFGDGTSNPGHRTNNVFVLCGPSLELLPYFEHFQKGQLNGNIVIKGGPNYFKQKPSIQETYSYLLGWLSGYFAADGCVSEKGNIVFSSCQKSNLDFVKDVCSVLGIQTYQVRKQDRISNLTNEPSTLWTLSIHSDSLNKEFFLLSNHRDRFVSRTQGRTFYSWKVKSVIETNRVEEVYCAFVENTHNFLLEDHIVTGNCFLLKAEDSREGWGKLLQKHIMALSTGGGVGTEYSDIRGKGQPIKRFGGVSSGPLSLIKMVNEIARHVMAGGKRRSALWAGLNWKHSDIEEFIHAKNWPTAIRAMKEQDFNFPAPIDMTNISVGLDDEFFKKVQKDDSVWNLYYKICKNMCKTGEPGFSINIKDQQNNVLRNPCTEVVSDTDSDVCNLGSINLPKIKDVDELKKVTRIAVRFLYLGTFRSWLPHEDFYSVREKQRRIGLGILGLHEWLLRQGERYEPNGELGKWLSAWANISDDEADKFSKKVGGVRPVAVRAIAPTGTIGILAETSTGIEPIYCVAYKRRYLQNDGNWAMDYVVDPAVKKLVEEGIVDDPNDIEDSIKLSRHVERRIRMQAYIQSFVDQAISSTINLPEWGEPGNANAKQFAESLLEYLPKLRGITTYPDGARPGQPIVPVKWETAMKYQPKVEGQENCKEGVCGI